MSIWWARQFFMVRGEGLTDVEQLESSANGIVAQQVVEQ